LYGRKFKVITDHAALKWLINVKTHHCARLTRWTLKLAEYDLTIEHKAGKKHVNADCLSRHISLVTTTQDREPADDKRSDVFSRESVYTAQQHDAYCNELRRKIPLENESDYIISEDGLLYVGAWSSVGNPRQSREGSGQTWILVER
jgi:hypothetical protein